MSKLTIEKWEEEGLHMLLDDGVGCLQSKSKRQIIRAKEAIEFQETLSPYLEKLNHTDNELLAAVMAADGRRTTEASMARTDAENQVILAYGRWCLSRQVVQGNVMVDFKDPHPDVAAEKRKPVDGKCPNCGAETVQGFGLMGGGYGAYWSCDRTTCSYFYKEQIPEDRPPTYIDKIAFVIAARCGLSMFDSDQARLLRIYALLALTKGTAVTKRDVHDAWCVWKLESVKEHKSLKPYDKLTKEVQDLDEPYRQAISDVSQEILNDELIKVREEEP